MVRAIINKECKDYVELNERCVANKTVLSDVVDVLEYIEHYGERIYARVRFYVKCWSTEGWVNVKTFCETVPYKSLIILEDDGKITAEDNFRVECKKAVIDFYSKNNLCIINENDVYIVWQCKILQNFKALVSTTVTDGRYFEITYDGDKDRMYIDSYVKESNEVRTFE